MSMEVRNLPIPSNAGNIWLQVQKLDSEEAKPNGHPYASTSQVKGTTPASLPLLQPLHLGVSLPWQMQMELWENANKALHELLTTKASIDACRQ